MTENILIGLITGGAAICASLVLVAYQLFQFRREIKRSNDEAVKRPKMEIIDSLIRYRDAISVDASTAAKPQFDAALLAVPAYFSHNKQCMDLYRSIGEQSLSVWFYPFVVELMKDVPLETHAIDKGLLNFIPTAPSKRG